MFKYNPIIKGVFPPIHQISHIETKKYEYFQALDEDAERIKSLFNIDVRQRSDQHQL